MSFICLVLSIFMIFILKMDVFCFLFSAGSKTWPTHVKRVDCPFSAYTKDARL